MAKVNLLKALRAMNKKLGSSPAQLKAQRKNAVKAGKALAEKRSKKPKKPNKGKPIVTGGRPSIQELKEMVFDIPLSAEEAWSLKKNWRKKR